jgi:hypothetical protein
MAYPTTNWNIWYVAISAHRPSLTTVTMLATLW